MRGRETADSRQETAGAGSNRQPSTSALTHPCPVEGCRVAHVSNNLLLCASHWARVPKRAQNDVWKTWASLQNATKSKLPVSERLIYNRAYVVARAKAIAWAEREAVPV